MSVTFLLPVLAASAAVPAGNENDLRTLVRESNVCLTQQVELRVPPAMVRVSDEERSAIRMAAVRECDGYNEKLAAFSNEYRTGAKGLKEIAESMRVDSLRIADAMIMTHVKSNAEAGR